MALLAPVPNARKLVEGSHSDSRGWTYKEVLLSCRRLVFTDYHVIFPWAFPPGN